MNKKNNKGFTFIELILYMAILGIFMVAVMSIVGTTVASNKKHRARQKLQTQATETYDNISNMVMGANLIMINGKGYIQKDSADVEVTGSFIVPNSLYKKNEGSNNVLYEDNDKGKIITKETVSGTSSNCYDIDDLKPFEGVDVSKDSHTYIDVDYLWINYDSQIGTTSFCTISYDKTNKKLYLSRATDLTGTGYSAYQNALSIVKNTNIKGVSDDKLKDVKKLIKDSQKTINTYTKYSDDTSNGTLLAKNVTSFQMQVNPEDNSVALIIGFQDKNTKEKYSVTGVVGLRNSFVLKSHEWN